MRILLIIPLLLMSCTTVYRDGKKVLSTSANAQDFYFVQTADGTTVMSARIMDHSTPILAVGKAVSPALAAWSAAQILKHAPDTINAFTGNHKKP